MVLDGIASSLLNRLLGDFVTGFDSANVKFSLSGELTLHNLKLKAGALDKLGLPISVKAGTISKLHLRVPWRSLGSQPAIISIEGLYILSAPASRSHDQYNEEEAEKAEQDAKQRKLALAESYKLARKTTPENSTNNDSGFFSRMLNSVLSTLQLKISNLHFRLEDPGIPFNETLSDFHSPSFAAGFSVSSLSGLSTDSQWNESTTSGSIYEMLLYKLLNVQKASVYMDMMDTSVYNASIYAESGSSASQLSKDDNINLAAFQELMHRTMTSRCDGSAHAYILDPTEAHFKVTFNRNPANFDFSQLEVKSVFSSVSLALRPSQIGAALFLGKRIEYFGTASRYLKWRPAQSPKENPRAWWKFVLDAVVRDVRLRHDPWRPEALDLRRKRRKAYVPLYSKLLDAKPLSTVEQQEFSELERVLNFDDIMFFRTLAEIRVQSERAQRQTQAASGQNSAGWGSWLGSFVWSGTAATATQSASNTPNANPDGYWESVHLTEEEQSQLFDAIHFERASSSSTKSRLSPPDSYIKYKFNWTQEVGELGLLDDFGSKFVKFAFFGLDAELLSKEFQNSFETSLKSVILNDNSSTDTHFPKIVYPHNLPPNQPLLRLKIVQNSKPKDEHGHTITPSSTPQKNATSSASQTSPSAAAPPADWIVDFHLNKLNIVWNTQLAVKVIKTFINSFSQNASAPSAPSSPPPSSADSLTDSSWISWSATTHRNQQLLALSKLKPSSNIRIHLEAPNLLIPEDCAMMNSPILVMELGTFSMTTAMSQHRDGVSSPSTASPSSSPASSTPIKDKMGSQALKFPSVQIATNSPASASHMPKMVDVSEYYDTYSFSVTEIHSFVTRTEKVSTRYGLHGDVSSELKPLSPYAHIINPFGFNLSLAVCKINVETMPNVKLTANLPQLHLTLSSRKLAKIKTMSSSMSKQLASISHPKTALKDVVKNDSVQALPAAPNRVSKFVEDLNYTESLAKKTDKPEEEMVAVGLGLSIELDAPEIIVTLVHRPSEGNQTSSGLVLNPLDAQQKDVRKKEGHQQLIQLKLVEMGYRLEAYQKLIKAKSFLQALSVEDFSQSQDSPFRFLVNSRLTNKTTDDYLAPNPLFMEETPTNTSLIHIDYLYQSPESVGPDELHNSCKLRFNELQVNLALNTINDVYNYIYQLTLSADSDSRRETTPSVPVVAPTSTAPKRTLKSEEKKSKKSRLKFLLDIECQAILINFVEKNTQPLAEISLRKSTATLKIIENQGYLLEVKLGNMRVLDTYVPEDFPFSSPTGSLSQISRRHVISVRGPHVIEFTLTNIPAPSNDSKEMDPKYHLTNLDVKIHSIRVLMNPKWVFTMILNVQELITVFTVPRVLEVEKQAPIAPPPVIDYFAKPNLFNYRVRISTPYIILPQDQVSSAMLITDWGEIEVVNSFEVVPYVPVAADGDMFLQSGCLKIREKLNISLKKANISSGQLGTNEEDLSPLSEMINTRLIIGETNINITIFNTFIAHTLIPRRDHELEVHVGDMKIFLSPEQVTFLFLVVQNTLFYQPTEAETLRKKQAALVQEAIELAKTNSEVPSDSAVPTALGTVRIQLECITIEAHDHYPLFPSSDRRFITVAPQTAPKVLAMVVTKSKIAWTNHSDDSLRLAFQIASISIVDIRPKSMRTNISTNLQNASGSPREHAGIDVVVPPPPGSKKSHLVGSCVTLPSKGQFSVSLTLNDFHCLPEASFLQQTWANLSPMLMGDLIGLLAHRERIMVSSFTPRQEAKWRAQRFHPEAGSTYTITLIRPQIVLSNEENSVFSSWLKFANLTSSSCEIGMKFMATMQSYDINLKEVSMSVGETFDTSLSSLFQPGVAANQLGLSSPLLDHNVYCYNVMSPFSVRARVILLQEAHDFEFEFLDQAKIALSHTDYQNLLVMVAPYGEDHTKKGHDSTSQTANQKLGSSSAPPTASSAQQAPKPKPKLKLKIKDSSIARIPTISDGVEYQLIKTEAKYQVYATSAANSTAKGGAAVDPKRPTDFWANLDIERNRSTISVPDLTLSTAPPRPFPTSNPGSVRNSVDGAVDESVHDEVIEITAPAPYIHKKLMVFTPKLQFMVMESREYDVGILRAELVAEECWLQDWTVDAYKASLTPEQHEILREASSEGSEILPTRKAAVRATISADSFNVKAAVWEPLLDPFYIDLGLNDRSLVVKSEASLNLTISETFLSSYKRFRGELLVEQKNSHSAVQTSPILPVPSSPHPTTLHPTAQTSAAEAQRTTTRDRIQALYYVKNETGLPMKYRLFAEDASLPHAEERTLAIGAEEAVSLPPKWTELFSALKPDGAPKSPSQTRQQHRFDRSVQSWTQKHMTMTATVLSFLAATNLSIDHIGTQVAHVGQNRLLVVDIQYRLGAKLITFKSRISIHNNTSVPLIIGKEVTSEIGGFTRTKSGSQTREVNRKDDFLAKPVKPHAKDDTEVKHSSKGFGSISSTSPRERGNRAASGSTPGNLLSASSSSPYSSRVSIDGSETSSARNASATSSITIKQIAVIEPYSVYCLPLDCMLDTVLRFRPGDPSSSSNASRTSKEEAAAKQTGETNLNDLDSMKFSWSLMRCDVKNLKAMDPIFVDCFPKAMKNAPGGGLHRNLAPEVSSTFQYSVGVSRVANKSAIMAGADLLVMHFQPPMIIENLLPASMTFSMEPQPPKSSKQRNTSFLPKVGRLKKGQKMAIHQMPAQCEIAFRMSVRGFEWSQYVLLREPEISGQQAILKAAASEPSSPQPSNSQRLHPYVVLTDKFEKRLQVQIENRVNDLGTRTISFYTRFWIVNKTGLPLMARAHISNTASIGAGMLGLYTASGPSQTTTSTSSADMIDERNGAGVYGGGDLRDLFMADLSAGCNLNFASMNAAAGSDPSNTFGLKLHGSTSSLTSLLPHATSNPAPSSSSSFPTNGLGGSGESPRGDGNQNLTARGSRSNAREVPATAKPMMYYPVGFENNRFHIKVAESRWSDAIVLNTQNDSTVLSIPENEDASRQKRKYEIALTIRPAANQFWRTRVVSIAPRYMVINKTPHSIFLRQAQSSYVCTLLPGEHAPLHWMDATRGLDTFRIKLNLPKCTWSGPIDPTQLEMFSLKLFNSETGLRYLVRVMVRMHPETAITTIIIKEEDMNAPLFRIDNYTQATLMVRQLNVDYATEAIPPLTRRVWGWLVPAYHSHRVQVLFNTQDKVALAFSMVKVKAYPPIQFQTKDGKFVWILAETSTDRTTRVLSIRPIMDPHIERWRRRFTPNPAVRSAPPLAAASSNTSQKSTKSSVDSDYEDEDELEESLRLHVSLSRLSVSLINAEPLELIYGSLSDIDVTFVNYSLRWSLDLRVGGVQIDNQIPTTFFPVAVFSLGDAPRDWLRFSLIRSYEYTDIIYQPFVSLLLRATTIRMDETLLLKLLDLTGVTLASFNETGKTALLTSNVDVLTLGDDEDASKMIYNHLYLLNPVALSISYLSSAATREAQSNRMDREMLLAASYSFTSPGVDRKQTNAILGIPDKFIPNVESAPLNLNALLLKHSFVSADQLLDRIREHYKNQIMRQLYAILGSFEALGNPISLVSNLGTGVKDLFYEPAKGIAISPEEFGAGLRRGGASFVTNTFGGLFNSTSKVLRAVGSGMAFISMDNEYQAKRDLAKRRDQPSNALTGVATGLKEFGEGLIDGVAGVFVQPIRGYQQEGALGIVKGVGKGLVGVAVKPVVGTLDLVQRTTEGISNTASANVLLKRARYPRYIAEDGIIRTFDVKNSLAMNMLHHIENLAFAHEEYWGYTMISLPKANHPVHEILGWVLIASSHRLAMISRTYSATSSATPSNAPRQSPSTAVQRRGPPSVQVHWIAPYPTIFGVEKLHETNGSFKLKISSRNQESVLITHTITCIDVNHLMAVEAFINENIKKWQSFASFFTSIPGNKFP